MAMGKRKRERQPAMFVQTTDLPTAASRPFYRRLNELLRDFLGLGLDEDPVTQTVMSVWVRRGGRWLIDASSASMRSADVKKTAR